MIGRIQALPAHVANQIAAGEVIESPASVVKELLENALDAKSTSITIDIGFGGLNHIIISDNGVGIHPDDLPLVVAPHATSKLRRLDDLSTLNTMGFRGEALASIASVSRVMVISRSRALTHASCLCVDGEQIMTRPAAREQGTTVEVRDLFYNASVRKTFLKPEALEYLNIESVVKRFALAEPSIALKLIHNEQVKLHLPRAINEETRHSRLKKLFGKTFLDNAIFMDVRRDDLVLTGWISHPHWVRSQSDRQWIYLNKRMVKDRLLMHAVKMAYETKIHQGKHPLYALYLNIPSHQVDVNVHPTKHEVRFTQPRLIHDFIYTALDGALRKTDEIQARSPVTRQPSTPKQVFSETASAWLTLNSRYAILKFEQTSFLVNIARLRHDIQSEMCALQSSPWPNRPLLIPVSLPLSNPLLILEKFQALLHAFGFECVLESQERLKITAIPAAIPLLDLHYFFEHLPFITEHQDAFLKHLFASDAWTLDGVTPDEKAECWDYWYSGMLRDGQMPYTIRLNEEACQELCRD